MPIAAAERAGSGAKTAENSAIPLAIGVVPFLLFQF
jgi:hypothetical protein